MRMVIIAIEGLDKSGKHTQSNSLSAYLTALGYNVVQSEFHRYDTPTGQLIQRWLYTQKGVSTADLEPYDVDENTIQFIMAADKQAQQAWFAQLERDGVNFLILDRYTASQICYATASGRDGEMVHVLQKYMRKPDMEILIDITPSESMRRKGKHGENDRYESDINFLSKVRETYLKFFSELPERVVISECDNLTVEELAVTIQENVSNKFILETRNVSY
jgi:dTMP kinase